MYGEKEINWSYKKFYHNYGKTAIYKLWQEKIKCMSILKLAHQNVKPDKQCADLGFFM